MTELKFIRETIQCVYTQEEYINLLNYLAGFFDGEGCICYYPKKNGKIIDFRAIVTNTRLEILKIFYNKWGGKITEKKRTEKDVFRKTCYNWVVWAKECEVFLKEIEPYLILKKEKAQRALLIRNTMEKRNRWNIVSEELMAKRRLLCSV